MPYKVFATIFDATPRVDSKYDWLYMVIEIEGKVQGGNSKEQYIF